MFVGIVCVFGNASQAWNCRCTVIFCGALIMDWLGGVVRMGDAPSSCHFGTTLSRKLASASWSPSCISCFSKYGGSWNLTSHETPTLFLLFFGSYGRKIPCAQCWWKVGSVGLLLKKTPYLTWFFYPLPPSLPPGWFTSSLAVAQSPAGTPLACRRQQKRQHLHQHHVFVPSSLPS